MSKKAKGPTRAPNPFTAAQLAQASVYRVIAAESAAQAAREEIARLNAHIDSLYKTRDKLLSMFRLDGPCTCTTRVSTEHPDCPAHGTNRPHCQNSSR